MIKALVFVDGELRHCLNISNALERLQNPLTRLLYIDAKYGYTDTQEYIQEILEDESYKKWDNIIITNSLIVLNDYRLKKEICKEDLIENYYIIDKEEKLKNLKDLTDKKLYKYQNLEEMYIKKSFDIRG